MFLLGLKPETSPPYASCLFETVSVLPLNVGIMNIIILFLFK